MLDKYKTIFSKQRPESRPEKIFEKFLLLQLKIKYKNKGKILKLEKYISDPFQLETIFSPQ